MNDLSPTGNGPTNEQIEAVARSRWERENRRDHERHPVFSPLRSFDELSHEAQLDLVAEAMSDLLVAAQHGHGR